MNNAGGNKDYGDKVFEGAAKKFGGAQGQKIAGNKAMSEKIVSIACAYVRHGAPHDIVADLSRLDRWPPQGLREGYRQEGKQLLLGNDRCRHQSILRSFLSAPNPRPPHYTQCCT
jgi:hypothetical protein